ncbi:hypothetical protein JXO52_02250 [bacterium]|nr:hypothetical protein [bacterium]
MSDKNSFLDYLWIVARKRGLIFWSVFIAGIAAAGLSFMVPVWYQADTSIMPPVENDTGFALSSVLSNLPVGNIDLPGTEDGTGRFMAILESRRVMQRIAVAYRLQERYRLKNMEETIAFLQDNTNAELQEDNTIVLSVMMRTGWLPDKAARDEARLFVRDIADSFIRELDAVNRDLKVSEARNTRLFIEERHAKVLSDLSAAEEALRAYQEENGVIALPEQAAAAIATSAELKAQIITKEVELEYLKRNFSESHSEFARKKQELAALNAAYRRYRFGTGYTFDAGAEDNLSMHELPAQVLQYGRLFREVMLQEKILEFIIPQLEQAKIQEARDSPTVQVLDTAAVPEKKAKPKRVAVTVLAMFFAFVFCYAWALFSINLDRHREQNTASWRKWRSITNELKHGKE